MGIGRKPISTAFRRRKGNVIDLHMGITVKQVENCIAQAMKRIRKARRRIESAGHAKN